MLAGRSSPTSGCPLAGGCGGSNGTGVVPGEATAPVPVPVPVPVLALTSDDSHRWCRAARRADSGQVNLRDHPQPRQLNRVLTPPPEPSRLRPPRRQDRSSGGRFGNPTGSTRSARLPHGGCAAPRRGARSVRGPSAPAGPSFGATSASSPGWGGDRRPGDRVMSLCTQAADLMGPGRGVGARSGMGHVVSQRPAFLLPVKGGTAGPYWTGQHAIPSWPHKLGMRF